MSWEIISAIAQAGAAVAMTITLIYLALQVRYLKRQNMLASFQHTYNAINDFDNSISQSEELASIVVRGQISRTDLTPAERLRFDHVFGRLLNIVESWQFQVIETTGAGSFREEQLQNIREFVRTRCSSPGVYDFWGQFKQCYNAAMHQLIEENIGRNDA